MALPVSSTLHVGPHGFYRSPTLSSTSCIDLVITDQLNLILDSGTRASLDPYCHHQIIYCKVNFRIRTTFHAIMCKSNRYKNSFFPNAAASWNLFMEIFNYKVVPSIGVLKIDILSLIRPVAKSVFRIHDPAGRYIFQLRVGLSPLKGHKWCHNFIDTPSGVCHCNQGIEDTSHFLLSCPFYVIQRETLLSSVNEILLKANKNHFESRLQLYLYGDPSINNSDNKNIILSTIKFIKETQRFLT